MVRLPRISRAGTAEAFGVSASVFVFAFLAYGVRANQAFPFDDGGLVWMHALHSDVFTPVMVAFTYIGSTYMAVPLIVLLGLWLYRKGYRWEAVFLVLSGLGAGLLNVALKRVFARPRPDLYAHIVQADGYAFPSGHAMTSTGLYVGLAIVAYRVLPRYRLLTASVILLIPLFVGISRVYLQVHYPSDVVAGWMFASAWVIGLNAAMRRVPLKLLPTE